MEKLMEEPTFVSCLQHYISTSASPVPLKERELNVASNRTIVERALSVIEYFSQTKSMSLKNDACNVISLSFSVVQKSQGGFTLSSPFCQDLSKRRLAFIIRLLNQNQFRLALREICDMIYTARNALSPCGSRKMKVNLKDMLKGVPFDSSFRCAIVKKMAISLHILLLELILKESSSQRSKGISSHMCNMADVSASLMSDGNLYQWIMSLDEEERQKRCLALSKTCYALSTSVFTIWKLCLLSKSQEFAYLSGHPLELKELDSVFHLMFSKNPTMVRDYAGSYLRELWKLCKDPSVGKMVERMEQDVISSSPTQISGCLEQLAAGSFDEAMKIIKDLEAPYELPPTAISLINRAARRVIETKNSFNGVCGLISLLSGATYDPVFLPYLDALIVNIKTWDAATHSDLIVQNLDTLIDIYCPQKDVKRIRILSNLLYHFGQNVLASDTKLAIDLCRKCIEYEEIIDAKGENLKLKCERMANTLIEDGLYNQAALFCKRVFKTLDQGEDIYALKSMFEDRLDRTMKLVCKILMNSTADPITLSHFSSSSRVKDMIACQFFHMVSSYRFPHKTLIVNNLLKQCCEEIESTAMVYLAYQEVGGLDNVLPCRLSLQKDPMWEGFLLFNTLIYGRFDHEKLKRSMSCLQKWLQVKEQINSFQMSHVTKVIDYLHHQGLYECVFSIVDQVIENKSGESLEELTLKRMRSENAAKNWKSHFETIPSQLEATLLRFDKCIQTNDIKEAETISVKLLKVMQTDEKLQINNKMGRAPMVSALYWHAAFCYVYSLLSFKKAEYVTAVINAKRCFRILQSILKRFLPSLLQYDYSTGIKMRLAIVSLSAQSFERLLDSFEHLGLAKDGEYYADEMVKLVEEIWLIAPILAKSLLYRCSIFLSLNGDEQRSAQVLERAESMEQFDQLCILRLSARCFHDSECLSELITLVASSRNHLSASLKVARTLIFGETLNKFLQLIPEEKEYQTLQLKSLLFQLKRKMTETPIFSSTFECVLMTPSSGGITNQEMRSSYKTVLENIESIMLTDFVRLPRLCAKTLIDQYVFVSQLLSYHSWKEVISHTDVSRLPGMTTERQLVMFPDDASKLLPEMGKADDSTNFSYDELMHLLPCSWLTITIDICSETGDLLIARISHHGSMIMRLPLERHLSRDLSCERLNLADVSESIRTIIRKSDLSTKSERTSSITTKEEREQWWRERKFLDSQLKELLLRIEQFWLGGFKGVFNVQESGDVSRLKNGMEKVLQKYLSESGISDEIVNLLASMDPTNAEVSKELEDLVYFVLDSLVLQGVQIEYDEVDMDQICTDLESLLVNHHETKITQTKYNHTVLVVGKRCHFVPWESLPCMRGSPVSRVLSLKHLTSLLKHHQMAVSKRDGFYILNPAGDLSRTEARFDNKFSGLQSWKGLVGMKPSEGEFVECLKGNLFVYMGHGGGEQYVRSKTIKRMDKIAPSLLLGCSSGAVKDSGYLEPYGTVLNYLGGGCPMILANMWDVTDKDIDKFSLAVFEKWGLFETGSMNICQAVAQSRATCHLKYLNGAAPIVYGLPLSLVQSKK